MVKPTTSQKLDPSTLDSAFSYSTDAWQRAILFLDTMRKRAGQYEEHAKQLAPNVLDYEAELICDGRTLARPVNYVLAGIVPPPGIVIDQRKRPFVVVDPRAGHGPGIGGFKADSEIGVALKAGHPCYFIGFLPDPVHGQTIEDIARAEAIFLEKVIERHPDAEGKPCVIGNCQAGWAVMILASLRPELFGPIIVAGTPLSYWAGVRGQFPMRYAGGLLGGSWLTALAGDLGAGIFDGASLVQNFESQNPANTLWSKQYNLYSKIDTEADRYLGFEKWWGGHVTLNAEEMQFIVDELFVGNKLAAGAIQTSDGTTIDLRNIASPIVVFCSKGDNITPPQQALDWILDLYDSVDDIRAYGQTIVYAVHETVGHLGIFVSSGVARKEHDEFASNIDLIDVLPPGLYEAVLEAKGEAVTNPDLVTGSWVMRCEARTLDDIRAMGGNDLEDERRFAAAARVSEINLALYRTVAQPIVQALVTTPMAAALRSLHPLRLSYEMFGAGNPWLSWVEGAAENVRENRQAIPADNPFLALQEKASEQIVESLENWRKEIEKMSEQSFHAIYGTSALQSALGVDVKSHRRPRQAAANLLHTRLLEARISELRALMTAGGLREGLARSLIYVGLARGSVDERGFEAIRRIRQAHPATRQTSLREFKKVIREQYYMLLIDEDAALAAIPALLPKQPDERRAAFAALREVLEAAGSLTDATSERLARIALFFQTPSEPVALGPSNPGNRIAS
ncbi:DUF3141 domain-containing protein [Bosea sp. NBC_00550]|uniref:DUF3141 domain-containing protein n=1 Tax=Bosea sp. NBC_00550 TaxID=2969621 RepID=UPI002231E870|nr:DUF3141 domain-containing protein [Bosea sp. NBC_00550]UZF91905.1 DUF3141 domain-containing protein [Bosea sp. NBC_00550]